ncbi:MAG: efflux transporter outer membrane subunit [Legionellales bacterium]
MTRLLLLATSILLSSCMLGPNYTRPALALPKNLVAQKPGASTVSTKTKFGSAQRFVTNEPVAAQWWTGFHSQPLNELVRASFQHNPSVGAAQEALHSALENIYAQQGAFYPSVGLSLSPTTQQTAQLLTSALASNQYNYSLYTGQVFVSYSMDVFGGIRRQVESLIAEAEFQHLQLEATYLTLAANVVNAAIQEAALREQIRVSKKIIASQRRMLVIIRQQAKLGDTSLADIAVQEAALATSQSTLPPLEKQLALERDLLNALTGRFPDDQRTPTFTFDSLQLPGDLPLSLPSALIEQRPDIRAAEEQMHAANALIGVAIANRLPNVSIGFSNAGTAATSLPTLFQPNTLFWALAGIVSQPVFDGGTLLHKQRAAQAIYKQAVAQYQLTVVNAFQNVADTLKSIRLDAIALNLAQQTQRAALTMVNIARHQFKAGDASILTVLVNEQTYQQAQLNLIQTQSNRLTDTVALFQALGGGWRGAALLTKSS